MHLAELQVVLGPLHALWVMIEWIRTALYYQKTAVGLLLRDESSTPPLNGPGPWLV